MEHFKFIFVTSIAVWITSGIIYTLFIYLNLEVAGSSFFYLVVDFFLKFFLSVRFRYLCNEVINVSAPTLP